MITRKKIEPKRAGETAYLALWYRLLLKSQATEMDDDNHCDKKENGSKG